MSDNDWSRVVHTTIAQHLKEVEVDILRNRKLLAKLEALGRVSTGWSGDEVKWPIQYRRAKPRGFGMGDTMEFAQKDRYKTAKLPVRGYALGDSVSKLEKLENKSVGQIVDVFSGMTDNLLDDMRENFCDELFIDGNASGNSKRMHGLESMFAFDAATALAANGVVTPDDTYAGLRTKPGYYGGTWAGTWPSGSGDAHRDFSSPVMVNTSSTNWVGAGHTTFAETGEKALRRGIMWSQRNKSASGRLDTILLEQEMFYDLANVFAAKEKVHVTRNEAVSLVSLGFTDVLNLDGVEISWEYGMPASTGYGFNCNQMGLRSWQDQLFVPEGPDYDIAAKAWRFSVDFFGNAFFKPRYFVKWYPYA